MKNSYNYLSERIYNKERQLEHLKNQYPLMVKKNKVTTEIIVGVTAVPLLLIIFYFQKYLFLNFGIPSLFIMPAECLFFIVSLCMAVRFGNILAKKKEDKFYQKMRNLENEKAVYEKQLNAKQTVKEETLNQKEDKANDNNDFEDSLVLKTNEKSGIVSNFADTPKVLVMKKR